MWRAANLLFKAGVRGGFIGDRPCGVIPAHQQASTLFGPDHGKTFNGLLRIGRDSGEEVLQVFDKPHHRGGLEQIGAEFQAAVQRIRTLDESERQIELGHTQVERDGRGQ